MDREIIFALLFAVTGTAFVGAFYFGEETKPTEPAIYAPNDIRQPLHQAAQKSKAKKKKAPQPGADYTAVEDYSDTTGEPDIEQPPAEEPELE